MTNREEKVKKKNKKSYLKKLIGLRRMGTAESSYWVRYEEGYVFDHVVSLMGPHLK